MKKFIIGCAGAAVLVSLSACSSMNRTNSSATPQTTNASPQNTVPFPENSGNSTYQPNASPNIPGSPGNQYIPPPAGQSPNGY